MLNKVHNFLNSHTRQLSTQTISVYEHHLKYLADWLYEQGLRFENLTPDLFLENYLNTKNWSSNTVRLAITAVKVFSRHLLGPLHPMAQLKVRGWSSAPQPFLDQVQLNELLEIFDTSTVLGRRNLAIVALGVSSGLRSIEICRLQLKHVDVEARFGSVLGKGDVWREFPFSTRTALFLDDWLSVRSYVANPDTPEFFVSIGGKKPGEALTTGGLRAIFKTFAKRAGLERLSPHDMRRTMARLRQEHHALPADVQQIGGWKGQSGAQYVLHYSRRKFNQTEIDKTDPIERAMD